MYAKVGQVTVTQLESQEAPHNREQTWLQSYRRRSERKKHERQHAATPEIGQQFLQDGHPTMMPTFTKLREKCMKRTIAEIQALEVRIESTPEDSEEWCGLVGKAQAMLRDLDKQFKTVVDRHQLEDPDYAASRGLSLTHFNKSGMHQEPWMLLTSDWSPASQSIVETQPAGLTDMHKDLIQKACHMSGNELPHIAFKRRKTLIERQHWAVRRPSGRPVSHMLVPSKRMKVFWRIMLGLAYLCLFLFLGVGVIATTTRFSPFFVETFFWIAVIWTMAGSGLLVAVVRAFGGNSRDSLSAMLASIALYLVIIQIGQTRLNVQDPTGAGIAFGGGD